ncbi:glycosyltransferase family 2 protein [Flindersiella endophytica]
MDPTDNATAARPSAPSRALRRQAGRLKQRAATAAAQTTHVRFVSWDTIEVSIGFGLRKRTYCLTDPKATRTLRASALAVDVPDPAALERLAGSGVLAGGVRRLRLRVETVPDWLRGGLRLPRTARDSTRVSWRASGAGLDLRLAWRNRHPVARALAELSAGLLRPRRWDQTGGPVYATDRADWLRGTSSWPQSVLGVTDRKGPFGAPDPDAANSVGVWGRPQESTAGKPGEPSQLVTAVANPHGRKLLGAAAKYTLEVGRAGDQSLQIGLRTEDGVVAFMFRPARSVEQTLLTGRLDKYGVIVVDEELPAEPFVYAVVRALGACGMVFAGGTDDSRAQLRELGLVTTSHPAEVDDLDGYLLSVAASRHAAIRLDPAIRHTPLAGGDLPLPAISVVIATKRPDDIATCLGDLAAQNYPAFEVLVGTHGYTLADDVRAELTAKLPAPLRFVEMPADHTLGRILGELSRKADGELISKVDDDDRYGPDHLTDLFLAHRTSGADLVAKSARFVHLADEGKTIDRTWAAPEAFAVTPAGGTMLLSRGVLSAAGGWSLSPRHVDADLLTRVNATGGLTYRTHGLGYVYTRRHAGHTWQADAAEMLNSGEILYEGLPTTILAGDPSI